MTKVPIPHDYPHVLDDKPKEFFNFKNSNLNWEEENQYEIGKHIGSGLHSEVYEGRYNSTNAPVILKMYNDSSQALFKQEFAIMRMLDGGPNVIQCLGVVHFQLGSKSALLLEMLDRPLSTFRSSICEKDVKNLSRQILEALDFCHGKGIIHFDLKPENIMINTITMQIKLIDFGSACLYRLYKPTQRSAGTLPYMSPETLLNYHYFNYAVDMWSFGCVLAEIVFFRRPFLFGNDKYTQMTKIVELLGFDGLASLISKYNMKLPSDWARRIPLYKTVIVQGFLDNSTKCLARKHSFNLIQSLLKFDPEDRLTASEALKHKFHYNVTIPLDQVPGPSSM